MRMLIFDQQMLLSVRSYKPAFGFHDDPVWQDKVGGVSGYFGRFFVFDFVIGVFISERYTSGLELFCDTFLKTASKSQP